MLVQKLDALRTYIQLIVRNAIKQKLNEKRFVLFEIVEINSSHPMKQNLIKCRPHILRPIVHRKPQLSHSVSLEVWLSAPRHQDVLEASQGCFTHLRVLVLQVLNQGINDRFHV